QASVSARTDLAGMLEPRHLTHRKRAVEGVDRAAARGRVANESDVVEKRNRATRVVIGTKRAGSRVEDGPTGVVAIDPLQSNAIERPALREHRGLLAPRPAHRPTALDRRAKRTSRERRSLALR